MRHIHIPNNVRLYWPVCYSSLSYTIPPTLTPAATKKLVERRNERFTQAVNEYVDSRSYVYMLNVFIIIHLLLQDCYKQHLRVRIQLIYYRLQLGTIYLSTPQNLKFKRSLKKYQILNIDLQLKTSFRRYSSSSGTLIRSLITKFLMLGKDRTVSITFAQPNSNPNTSLLAELAEPVSDNIWTALRGSRKITSLYTHQVAAINALSEGQHVIVSTSTASGKSVIYQVRPTRSSCKEKCFNCARIGPSSKIPRVKSRCQSRFHLSYKSPCPGSEGSTGAVVMRMSRTWARQGILNAWRL